MTSAIILNPKETYDIFMKVFAKEETIQELTIKGGVRLNRDQLLELYDNVMINRAKVRGTNTTIKIDENRNIIRANKDDWLLYEEVKVPPNPIKSKLRPDG